MLQILKACKFWLKNCKIRFSARVRPGLFFCPSPSKSTAFSSHVFKKKRAFTIHLVRANYLCPQFYKRISVIRQMRGNLINQRCLKSKLSLLFGIV